MENQVAQRSIANKVRRARQRVTQWFASRGWSPFPFQRDAWDAYLRGQSGLIHASTGTGKSYAAWMGPLIEALAETQDASSVTAARTRGSRRNVRASAERLRVLWVTPLRALAADTLGALAAPATDFQLPWTIETRTSDTSSRIRSQQRTRLPTVLITTPESLSLLLSQPQGRDHFSQLRLVVVDEWHELLATKRGVQTELALARLRTWQPRLRTWGISATLGNVPEALRVLLGVRPDQCRAAFVASTRQVETRNTSTGTERHRADHVLIRGDVTKRVVIDALIPASLDRFPWAGHLGLQLAGTVVDEISAARSSLVFTNTRAQSEAWFQEILLRRPDWASKVALHHGSIDRDSRADVEEGLRAGRLKCVVCTSTLDLGVDFSPVERVFQVGSPKGVARLLQRAGRSGHDPDRDSRVTCVPAHALELLEVAAARDAVRAGFLESRVPPTAPIDVLTQHVVTVAIGGGFEAARLLDEVRTTATYASVPASDWDWILDFVTTGGVALKAYPDYRKVQQHSDGMYRIDDVSLARRHRLSIGTIVGDATVSVHYVRGGRLGTIDESFFAKIKPGERFVFAGKVVELVRVQDSRVWVRRAKDVAARVPRWQGGRMPLSTELAAAVRDKLDEAARGKFDGPEMEALRPLLTLQEKWSHIPRQGDLLIEHSQSREGHHLYFYPFAGRLVHEGLASLLAYRLSRQLPITFNISVNDYGFELLSAQPAPLESSLASELFGHENLVEDIAACMNAAEMGRRQFREIAHIAGLVFGGYPGNRKSARQLQASTGLIYDVFATYDPQNLLLRQAHRDVLERQLEHSRLRQTLMSMQQSRVVQRRVARFSPLAFPLLVSRLRERLSSEKLADRVRRMQQQLEKAAGQA